MIPNRTPAAAFPRAALALAATLLLALLLVPYSALEAIRHYLPWVGATSHWLAALAPGLDLEHFVAFTALGALARLAQGRWRERWTWLLLVLFSVGTELAQAWIPTRSPNPDDLVLNLAGAGLGYTLACLLVLAARLTRRT